MNNEELTAKVGELEAKLAAAENRLGWVERAIVAQSEMQREANAATLGGRGVEALIADAKRYPGSKKDAVESVRLLLRPLLLMLPAELRPKLVTEDSPAGSIRAMVKVLGVQFGPEQCTVLGIAADDAEAHALTWADLGVGADGALS